MHRLLSCITARLERRFLLRERQTTILTETRAGFSTFIVMAYIIFVNPAILGNISDPSGAILPSSSVLSVTCLTAGFLTILMGVISNYPFALAPGMGLNALVAFYLVGHLKLTWVEAMTMVLIEGSIIMVLVLTQLRQAMMKAIPLSLKKAIGVGVGLFLALIGFVNGGLVSPGDSMILSLGGITEMGVLVFLFGFFLTIWLIIQRIKGALLFSILLTTLLAVVMNNFFGGDHAFGSAARLPSRFLSFPQGLVGPEAIFGRCDLSFLPKLGILSSVLAIFSIMLSDFFDTMGTIVGLGEKGSFLDRKGNLPKIGRVLLVDSLGAAIGGLANSSSNTTYIESSTGITEGGRTGLTSVVAGILFLLAMFFSPIAEIIPKEATAPSLVLVGFFDD